MSAVNIFDEARKKNENAISRRYFTRCRFPIGTQFMARGEHPIKCTVTDILKTFNSAGRQVRIRYVATYMFEGHEMVNFDVREITIFRGFIK